MNKLMIVVLCCVLCASTVDLNINEADVDNKIIMSIYPTGTMSETYYFCLDSNGKLVAKKGERNGGDVNDCSFIKKCQEQKVIYLSEIDTEQIYSLAENVVSIADSIDYVMAKDSWEVQILYKGELIKQNYDLCTNQKVNDLVDEIIKASGVEVDIHGWA